MPEQILWEKQNADGRSRSSSGESAGTSISKAQNAAQFILDDLELLLGHNSISAMTRKAKTIKSLKEDLEFIRYFLERVQESPIDNPIISDLAYDISAFLELLLVATDSYMCNNIIQKNVYSAKPTGSFLQYYSKVTSLVRKIKIMEVSSDKGGESFTGISSRQNDSSITEENRMVGFDAEATELLDKLIGGTKQLEVISIIGMKGSGKTTLAKRVYNDPLVSYYFHVRAWTCVSEFYDKSNLLENLLSSIEHDKDQIFNTCAAKKGEKGEELYKSLKGRRYFVVIDDIWSVFVWYDLKILLPNDNNGSRILLTSCFKNVALRIKPENQPLLLRFLNQDESWDLFKQKVFPDNIVPEDLAELGKRIVANCKGLPHAIVAIARVLAKEEKTVKCWRDFAKNIRSSTGSESLEHMEGLELSYKHLPMPLQSCFLYLGTFPEDYEIPVKRLIWSWIGEGFVEHTCERSLEDVAEDCLMELINSSLVIVVKKRTDGGIKSCQIHNLLRDFCLKKAKQKRFLQPICDCHTWKDPFCSEPDHPDILDPFSTCGKHFHFNYYDSYYASAYEVFTNNAISLYKFLRRLELGITLVNFPEQISQLLHLRYLALKFECISHSLQSSIFELWNLETCILDVKKGGRLELPLNFWKMVNLRHLCVSQELLLNGPPPESSTIILENLQTISQLCPSGSINYALAKIPKLRNLGFHLTLSEIPEPLCFPDLSHLNLLKTLKFEYQTLGMVPFSFPHLHKFPPNLKKLTLVGSHVHWEEMSIVALLPNLEILKIKDNFFSGLLWETTDDGFSCLKFLKLSHMDLHKWISSTDHFPRLEHLVLNGCLELEEIPFVIGDISTLQTIKVYCSSDSTMESAKQILKYQKTMGNDDLEVFLYHHLEEF